MGIDLGTANTLVCVLGRGIVLEEPSVVAIDRERKVPLAFGEEAKKMIGRTSGNIIAVRPLKDGVIADFESARLMLEEFIRRAQDRRGASPRMVIGVPTGITEVERRVGRVGGR